MSATLCAGEKCSRLCICQCPEQPYLEAFSVIFSDCSVQISKIIVNVFIHFFSPLLLNEVVILNL